VGEKKGSRVFVHVTGLCIQLHIGHPVSEIFDHLPVFFREQDKKSAEKRAVTHVLEFLPFEIGEEADSDCIFHIQIAAESAGDKDKINCLEIQSDVLEKE